MRKSYQKGSIKEHNGRWTLRYHETLNGRKHYRREVIEATGPKSARKAADERMRVVNALANRRSGDLNPTVREYVNGLWKQHTISRDQALKPATLASRDSIIKAHVIPGLGNVLLKELTPADLTGFFAARTHLKQSTLRQIYVHLRHLLDIAIEFNLIEKSPLVKRLHYPTVPRTQKPKLTAQQIRAVIAAVPSQYKPLITLLAVTSIRAGEALSLFWEDLSGNVLWVRHSLYRREVGTPKTASSIRQIHLPAVLVDVLEQHRQTASFTLPTDLIFARPDGTAHRVSELLRYMLHPAMKAAGIESGKSTHGFHIFRRSAARMVYQETGDVKMAQALLGHSNIHTTADCYIQDAQEVTDAGTEAVARHLFELDTDVIQ